MLTLIEQDRLPRPAEAPATSVTRSPSRHCATAPSPGYCRLCPAHLFSPSGLRSFPPSGCGPRRS